MRLTCVQTNVRRRDIILMQFAKATGAKLTTMEWDKESIPVIVGNNYGCDDIQMECRARNHPYIYIDHAYFKRGYDTGYFRFCVSHFHTTDWRETDKEHPEPLPWKGGDDVIVIPPSRFVQKIYACDDWLPTTLKTLSANTKRRIVVKEKLSGPLAPLLYSAHAIVSYGSVAEVEAALAGVPVFTTCGPSLPIAQTDFSRIETPIFPDREKWLSALAGAEWHLSELDKAWSHLNEHYHLCRVADRSS